MRKNIRSVVFIAAIAFAAVLLTACYKTPLNSDVFRKVAKEKGYNIYNVTDQYVNAPQIKEVFIAAPENREFQIEFYTITDRDSAMKLYQVESDVFDGYQGQKKENKVTNGKNYARRVVVAENENYLMVSYIDNTLVYVPPTPKENREAIEEFLNEIKY